MKSKIEMIYKLVNAYALISKLPNKTKTDVAIKIVEMDTIMKELVDLYLNSQDQPEEKPIYVACMGEEIVAGTDKSIEKHRKDIEDFLKGEDTPEEKTVEERMKEMETPYIETAKLEEWNENERRKRDKLAMDMLDNAYKLHYVKDTPEEWENKQRNLIEKAQKEYFNFKRQELLLSTDVEIYRNTREHVEEELVWDIINLTKQLLEDREREVLQEIIGMAKTMAKDYYSGNTQLYLDVRNVQDKLDKLNNKKK